MVNNLIYFVLIGFAGYGIAYFQFAEQNHTLNAHSSTVKPIIQISHKKQFRQSETEKHGVNKLPCADDRSFLQQTLDDEDEYQEQVPDIAEQGILEMPVYSSADYSDNVEKKIIPNATQVMIAIPESEQEELIEIIDTEEQESEWGHRLENQISNFVTENDINSAIDISLLICKTNYCRMEVMVNNAQDWMMLFKRMSEQPWWNMATFKILTPYAGVQSVILYRLDDEQSFESFDHQALAEAYSTEILGY